MEISFKKSSIGIPGASERVFDSECLLKRFNRTFDRKLHQVSFLKIMKHHLKANFFPPVFSNSMLCYAKAPSYKLQS